MTSWTTRSTVTALSTTDVPAASRCLPAGTPAWSCRTWNSGRKVISRVLGSPRGELTRPAQQTAVRSIRTLHARHDDPALLLIALYVTAHELHAPVPGEAVADAVSELAAMSEEGVLTGFRIRFPAEVQLTTVAEIIAELRSCVTELPRQ